MDQKPTDNAENPRQDGLLQDKESPNGLNHQQAEKDKRTESPVEADTLLRRQVRERRKAEAALRLSEEESHKRRMYLESVLSHAPDAIITLDAQHRIIDWNPGAEAMFGYSAAETKGKNLDQFVANSLTMEEAVDKTRQVLAGRHVQAFETVRYRKDGTPVNVIAAGSPIIIGNTLAGVVAVYTDVTALKKVEYALRENEEQMRAVFDTIPDPVTLVRLGDGVCRDVNAAFEKVAGYTRAEVIGRTAEDLNLWVNPADREKLIRTLNEHGEVHNLEAEFRLKDGNTFAGLMSARQLNFDGCAYFISITRDVSELRDALAEKQRLEAQLQKAHKLEAIGALAGGIAHDFNNLLMGIQGRAALMLDDCDPEHPFYEHLQGIGEYARRAAGLTRQLLGFARGGKYEIKTHDPNELVAASLSLFGRTHKEIDIHTSFQDRVSAITADRSQIEQVLLNLFVNAWQAMPDGGRLSVATANATLDRAEAEPHQVAPGEYVKITVSDTGIGMDAAIQDRIFDPFFTTKERGIGTGLGLASAYGIVQNHGGVIKVFSQPGQGATFTIFLPADHTVPVPARPPVDDRIQLGTETVLLVDDEQMILEVGRAMIERLGYNVLTADSGESALHIFERNISSIAVVVLDMMMPGMGGEGTFQQLKTMRPDVRVLLSSGYSLKGQADKILAQGCRGFIQKPFDIQQLSQKLREVLDACEW